MLELVLHLDSSQGIKLQEASAVELHHQRRSLPERKRLLSGPVHRLRFELEVEVEKDLRKNQAHFSISETVQKTDVSLFRQRGQMKCIAYCCPRQFRGP